MTMAKEKDTLATMSLTLPADLDPETAAKDAGLRYLSDDVPGITRVKKGATFSYIDTDGHTIRDADTLKRIRALVIPPAWKNVWISPSPRGHIQATGRDEKGRKQYRYHAKWRDIRNATKFDKLVSFGFVLPKIRYQVFEDLQADAFSEQKILATIVRLLDTTHMRIGNEEYAKENQSYGLTTLRNKHVTVDGANIRFTFRGKSGVEQEIDLHDRRLAKIIRQCQELPGHELFQFIDDNGKKQPITSEQVNNYVKEIAKEEFTAKDFRTWGGTVQAAISLLGAGEATDESHRKSCLVCAVKDAATVLGNRPATCRKYYIDPRIFEAYEKEILCMELEKFLKRKKDSEPYALTPIEKGVHHILKEASNDNSRKKK